MDKIFINGIVRTLDRAYPVCEAVGIKGGIILMSSCHYQYNAHTIDAFCRQIHPCN